MSQTNSVYQAIVILKGTPEDVVAKEIALGSQVVYSQYTPGKASFLGSFEAKQFGETYDKWIKENDAEIRVFYADDELEMNDIEFKAVSLETVPSSAWGDGQRVLVLGPFEADRLDFHLVNCTEA